MGYDSDRDEPKIKKKSLKLADYFVKASGYQGDPEPMEINGIVVPEFEIFQDMLGQKPIVEETANKEEEDWEEELLKLESLTLEEAEKSEKDLIVEEEVYIDDESNSSPESDDELL